MSTTAIFLKKAKNNLQKGRLDKAETFLAKVLKKHPNNTDALYMSGLIAGYRQQYPIAIQYINRAIKNNPKKHTYYVNLGIILNSAGQIENSLAAYKHATQLKPDDIDSHITQASILNDLGKFYEVVKSLQQVIRINPNIAGAHSNLGSTLLKLGYRIESENSLRKAIELDPEFASAHANLGFTLREMGRLVDASESLQYALKLKPDFKEAYNTYGLVMMGLGHYIEAENALRKALGIAPGFTTAHDNLLFVLATGMKHPQQTMLKELKQWDKIHGHDGRLHPMPARTIETSTNKKLRIGYISPDFRSNVVSYFITPLLASHDHNHFEIFCYATHSPDMSDDKTERIQAMVDHWRSVNTLDDKKLAKLIHDDAIDILIDITGHLKNNSLKVFTYRPAPIQASYLGFMAATGLEAMDYWITDDILHPKDTTEESVEEIFRLPRCWVCYEPPTEAPDVSPCPNLNEKVTFGSFSNISKLSSNVIESWSKILTALPGSNLLIMDKPLSDPKTRKLLIDQFSNHGIAVDRLLIECGAPFREYLSIYAKVDIVLDPFPRTGGTTTAEALWMGVPVITLAGQLYAERISASKLTAIGLEDLVTKNQSNYIDRAIALAHNPEERKALRSNLRKRMAQSPLCDGKSLAHAMEKAFLSMWKQYTTKSHQKTI